MVISATSIFWCKHFLLVRNILYSGMCFTLEHPAFLMLECSLHKIPFNFSWAALIDGTLMGYFKHLTSVGSIIFFSVGKLHLKVVDLYSTPKHDLVTSDVQILTLATFVVYIMNDGWQSIYLYVSFMVHTHNSDAKFIPRTPSYR